MVDFGMVQFTALCDAVPFQEAISAACGGCVLGDEDRVATHWCLASVVTRGSGFESLFDELSGVFHDLLDALFLKVCEFALAEPEAATEP